MLSPVLVTVTWRRFWSGLLQTPSARTGTACIRAGLRNPHHWRCALPDGLATSSTGGIHGHRKEGVMAPRLATYFLPSSNPCLVLLSAQWL